MPAQPRREPHHCCGGAGAGGESRYRSFRCWRPGSQQDAQTQETREGGRRELVDRLRGNFPHAGTPGLGAGQARSSRNCGQLGSLCRPPTLTAPTFQKSPWGGHGRSRSWGLGARARTSRGRSRAWARGRGQVRPGALDSGVRSRARLSPSFGTQHELFCSRTSGARSPGSPGTGSGLGDPARRRVTGALHSRGSAPPEAPGPAPRPGARGSGAAPTYFFLLHEPHQGCPLDLRGLAQSVVEGQDEAEEGGFPQIGSGCFSK